MTTNELFFNRYERLRSGWRFAIFFFSFSFVSMFEGLGIILVAPKMSFGWQTLISTTLSLITATILSWLACKFFEELPLKSLGFLFAENWKMDLVYGVMIGYLTIMFACLIGLAFNGYSFYLNVNAPLSERLTTLVFSFLIFLVAAANEEIIFRGYLLQTFARANLAWFAIAITAAIFGIVHTQNPNFTYISLLNTVLAGGWFGLAYLKTRSIWFPLGIHFCWNWVQGAILGIPVSGITELTPYPFYQRIDSGPTWLTGGSYGIEAGIACTIAIIASICLIHFLPIPSATKEMLALTNKENPKTDSAFL